MVTFVSDEPWLRFRQLLPRRRDRRAPVLPSSLAYRGRIHGPFDYVLPDDVLSVLRHWLLQNSESVVFYFITETVSGQPANFQVDVQDLTAANLAAVNPGGENVLTGLDYSWALFVDHEGGLHVAGPHDLFEVLRSNHNAGNE